MKLFISEHVCVFSLFVDAWNGFIFNMYVELFVCEVIVLGITVMSTCIWSYGVFIHEVLCFLRVCKGLNVIGIQLMKFDKYNYPQNTVILSLLFLVSSSPLSLL